MKLINTYPSLTEAREMEFRLKKKGIFAYAESKQMHYADKTSLWVVLDEQYDDAIALLNDPHHNVMFPLSEAEMVKIELDTKKAFQRSASSVISKYINWVFVLILVGSVGYFFYRIKNAI